MYYRRWTRMYFIPALRYFHKYGVLGAEYDFLKPIIYQETPKDYPPRWKPTKRTKMENLDQKLMDKLFLKYPDLKFESLDRAKLESRRQINTFSYAYSFLSEQKRMIDRGYSIDKAFELAEAKFQDKINRKMDQTLLSRGLAIGNRARSFLNVYQQQMEYESRLKTRRTRRELLKYQEKLASLKEKVEGQPADADIYARMLYKVEEAELFPENKPQKLVADKKPWQQREDFVNEFETNIKSVFEQFYQNAASKDRLQGLKDQQILNQVMDAPGKIKRRLGSLLKKLAKYGVKLKPNGQVDYSNVTNPRIKKMLMENDEVKMALMTAEIDFELPHREQMKDQARKYAARLAELEEQERLETLSQQQRDIIYKNKKIAYLPYQSSTLREEPATYKAFETSEERLLRIEIKWLRNKIADLNGSVDQQTKAERQQQLQTCIDRMRRLKHRIEQKNLLAAEHLGEDGKMIFNEHKELGKDIMMDSRVEYEELLHYLKKKVDERRVSTYEEINDDKINKLIERVKIQEDPREQGFKRVDKRE